VNTGIDPEVRDGGQSVHCDEMLVHIVGGLIWISTRLQDSTHTLELSFDFVLTFYGRNCD